MDNEGLSFGVLGTGALGGLYGGLLAQAGEQVRFFARSDFEHIQQHGLRVESPLGDFCAEVDVYDSPESMPQVDVAILSWKTTANSVLADILPKVLKPNGIVLVLQNGLEIERDVAEIIGEENVLGGCCFLCSNKIGPGHIHHLDYGTITFGEYAASLVGTISERMKEIEKVFRGANIDMRAIESLPLARWKKLTWNIPFNGLSVVLDANTKEIMTDPETSQLAEDLMSEVRESARVCGFEFEEAHIEKMLDATRKMVPYDSSMSLDYKFKRPIEVESIVGNPLRSAIQAGYRPQKIEMLYHQLCFLDKRNRQV